jgi:peptidoglycan/xylan/chitin deacetylase (PgdA/CDA1 family)
MIKVSVIIPAYNAKETIAESLQSLGAQTFTNWEAIVIDNGSSDDTLQIATEFAEKDSRIRVISQSQKGVCLARNTGIAEAKNDWLLFLDADDWILPQHLECLTDALTCNPSLDLVYSGWARITADGALFYEEFRGQPTKIFHAFARNCVFVMHTCLVRRSTVVNLGGFDTSLRTCEDWDLWQRIARTGARFGAISHAFARYRMRSHSASMDVMQLLCDGLRVITTGHSLDPRVPNPASAYANGMPVAELAGAKLDYVCWNAGLALGHGGNPLTSLRAVSQECYPGLNPELLAEYIFKAPLLPSCRPLSAWDDLWPGLQGQIQEFLTALEAQSMTPTLTRRVFQRLENLILDHSTAPRPLTLGATYAVRVEVTEPIPDIVAPSTVERLHCAVEIEGKPLGNITLPIFDGFSSYVLQDAIAAKFAWEILEHFFKQTVYPTLTVKQSLAGASVWRGSVCLADGLPEERQALWAVAHDRIGWTVFLQELWGLPSYPGGFFYTIQLGKKAILKILKERFQNLLFEGGWKSAAKTFISSQQYAEQGRLTVEVSEDLPNILVSTPELLVMPTVGKVPLGIVSIEVNGNRVSAQKLRAAITRESGLELAVVAVREGLLGRPITGTTLRDRLVNKPTVFSIENSYGIDRGVVLGRHPGAIGTSVCRRAMLPINATNDLIKTALVTGESVVKVPGVDQQPERLVYAPELICFPDTTANLSNQIGLKSPVQQSSALNLREHFETLFAQQADPWKYTVPYEQKKYEQTLELLPPIKLDQVLELACAEGHFTVQLAPRVGSLLAADISQVALERAGQRCTELKNVHFHQLDLTKDLIPGRFDLIICSEVLYYVGGWEELRACARKIADALNPGGYFLTAHANLVVDQPDQPGYNWDHPFGAKGIGDTFAHTQPLQLIKELWTPLYRIQLFQAGDGSKYVPTKEPEIIKLPQPTPPPPFVAADVLWNGGSPHHYDNGQTVTTHLPILMYHRVHLKETSATARYRVTPEAFAEQLRYLRDAGFYSITLEAWRIAMATKTPLPGRAILITFDDGYQDFRDYAWPLLKRYGFSATVFLVADEIGGSNRWDSFYGEEIALLDWSDIRKLQDEGVEFGSHSVTHRHLTALSPWEIVSEGARSRAILQQGLDRLPNAFAYPYGDQDDVVQHLLGACGYVFGLSCKPGLSRFQDSLLALPRIEITGYDGLQEFVAKLNV